MAAKDYYEILGVQRGATEQEIRQAFRRLAKKHHPDRNKGEKKSEQRFKEINEAYSVLIDKQKRAQYDQFGEARDRGFTGNQFWENYQQQQRRRPTAQPESGFEWDEGGDLGDVFSQFFRRESPHGARTWRTGPSQGEDIEASIEVPFDTAVQGGTMQIGVPSTFACKSCHGSGGQPGTQAQICPTCHGTGNTQAVQGAFAFSRPCPHCYGRGQIITTPCATCHGSGQEQTTRRFNVRIPRGVQDGQKIRLAGQGQPGFNGGPGGDLLVEVHVAEHPDFTRKGLDIFSEVEVSIVQATLGTRLAVRTVGGEAAVRVPPGTQPGTKLRLRERGISSAEGRTGDHIVTIRVAVPREVDAEAAALLRQFGQKAGIPSA